MPVRRHRWIAVGLSLLVLTGCHHGPTPRSLSLLPGTTYEAPGDHFTAVVPPLLGPNARQVQTTAPDGSVDGVTFSDDFGTLLDVQSRRLDGGDPSADAAFDGWVLPGLRTVSPGATVLRREVVTGTPVGPALFVVVSLPGGSTRQLRDAAGNPVHPDAVRGVLVFPQLGWAYAVSVQQWPPTPNAAPRTPEDRDARLLSDLKQAVAQMTFD